MKLLIKNGMLTEDERCKKEIDILIENDYIIKMEENITDMADRVVDAKGCYVSPGFIDIHTHCFPKGPLGLLPDTLGIERWASTIIDAGTSGEANFEEFKEKYIDTAKTRVFALLNASSTGLEKKHELDSLEKINEVRIKETIDKYQNFIVGIKARASQSVVGELGITPIHIASDIAKRLKKPLTVHVGNHPPKLVDVLSCLGKGDIVTHTFHGKIGGILNNERSGIVDEVLDARKRGVLFDVGHGSASFSFDVYKKAMSLGFDCDVISSDLHIENFEGPVYSLVDVVTKVINCGESLSEAVKKVTQVPACIYGLRGLGELKVGNIGDVFVFKIEDTQETVEDAMQKELKLDKRIKPVCLVVSRGEKSGIYQ